MPPILRTRFAANRTARLMYTLLSATIKYLRAITDAETHQDKSHVFSKRATEVNLHEPKTIVFIVLIPVLVLLSGLFAGLTLGYMSLDETQLNVLSASGTPKQREYARKIQPIRKNGHLLLVTLLLSNMIVNESLPIIADPVLGGGAQSVVVSTVLIVIFSEIIPQSLFTRHGLYLGAKMAGVTTVLIWVMGIIAWPVAKLLEWVLGPHQGIIYRRAELKELIAMHSNTARHGGDLNSDTVNIIGATLDFQEKTVLQAMTPINKVFMLSIDAKLDADTMQGIVSSGHSRIPVFEDIDIPTDKVDTGIKVEKVKRIIGILLVKRLVLHNVQSAVPIRSLQLNKVFTVPSNQSLLGILNKFQEGHSHLAVVSRLRIEKAETVRNVVKSRSSKQLSDAVAAWDTDSDGTKQSNNDKSRIHKYDIKMGKESSKESSQVVREVEVSSTDRKMRGIKSNHESTGEPGNSGKFVFSEENADDFLEGLDSAAMPLGIITLEDVLEEIIGEDIFDEFDMDGSATAKTGSFRGGMESFGRRSMKFMRSISSPQIPRLSKRKSTKEMSGSVSAPKPEGDKYDAAMPEISSQRSPIDANMSGPNAKGTSVPVTKTNSLRDQDAINRAASRRYMSVEKAIARGGQGVTRSASVPNPRRIRTRGSFKSEPLGADSGEGMRMSTVNRDSPEPIIPVT